MSEKSGLERALSLVARDGAGSGTHLLAKLITEKSEGYIYLTGASINRWLETKTEPPLEIAYVIEIALAIPAMEVSSNAVEVSGLYWRNKGEIANGR